MTDDSQDGAPGMCVARGLYVAAVVRPDGGALLLRVEVAGVVAGGYFAGGVEGGGLGTERYLSGGRRDVILY